MSLTGEAIYYLQQNYPNASFMSDIILQDDSDGRDPYVKHWGVGTSKPTEEEINLAAESMQPKPKMPTIEDQLVMIYNDKKNGTNTFVDAIDAYKQAGGN